MYNFLGTYVYPDGRIYSGPATECYYSFYASKSFAVPAVYDHIVQQSDIAAGEQGAVMLMNRAWVDQSGANNLFAVKFDGHGQGIIGQGISGISLAIPAWVMWVILACVVFGFSAYIVKQLREISYSPAGEEMWSALKWIGIGVTAAVAIPLLARVLPRRET